MISYGFYNSLNGDRRYNATHFSSIFDGIIKDGVFMSIGDALIVSANENMTINVGEGKAWFNHTWTLNDSILPLDVEISEMVLNRIDAVVLEVNSNDAVRANSIKIVRGTPASEPVNPTLINEELIHQYPLAYIYVGAGVTEITQANITNMVGTSECPFITGVLETIEIDPLVAQWEARFDELLSMGDMELTEFILTNETAFVNWFENVKNQLSEDAAGNLQLQIDELKAGGDFIHQTDVVDNLLSSATNMPLSANQGRLLGAQLNGISLVPITQEAYDALGEGRPSTNLYIIVEGGE